MIFDTDVIIWAQRGKRKIADLIEENKDRQVSIVTYMEFIQFAADKKQFALSKSFFSTFDFETLPLSANISHRASTYIERFSLSHGMEINDALIAATAFEHGLPLATTNHKDYAMIEGLRLIKLKVV